MQQVQYQSLRIMGVSIKLNKRLNVVRDPVRGSNPLSPAIVDFGAFKDDVKGLSIYRAF